MPKFEIQLPKTQDTIQLKNPVIQIDIPEGYTQHNNSELEDPRTFNENGYKYREDLVYNWLKNAGPFARHFVLGVEDNPWRDNDIDGMSREEVLKRFHERNAKKQNEIKESVVKEAIKDSVLRDLLVAQYRQERLKPNAQPTDEELEDFNLGGWTGGVHSHSHNAIIYPSNYKIPNDTRVHERSHNMDEQFGGGNKTLGFPKKLRIIQRDPEDTFMKHYLNSWDEIKARLMQVRYNNKLDPTHKYNIFEIENMRKDPNFKDNSLIRRYDNQTLLDLLNNVAQTTPSNPYKSPEQNKNDITT